MTAATTHDVPEGLTVAAGDLAGDPARDLANGIAERIGDLRFDRMGEAGRDAWLRTFSAIDGAVAAGRSRALAAAVAGCPRKAAARSAELVQATGMSTAEARRAVRLSDTLDAAPAAAQALAAGDITPGHATALANGVPWLYRSGIGSDPALLDAARTQTVDEFATTVSTWTRSLDGDLDGRRLAARQHRERRAGWTVRSDGMVHIDADLPPDTGSMVTGALHALAEHLWRTEDGRPGGPDAVGTASTAGTPGPADGPDGPDGFDARALVRTTAQRQADALVELARRAGNPEAGGSEGATGRTPGRDRAGRPRVDLLVAVDLDAITLASEAHGQAGRSAGHRCGTADGVAIAPAAARRLACDAGVIPAVLGSDGDVLDLGRRTRTVGTALRNALVLRDGGCTFPGCDRPTSWCDAHHLHHWADGGPTDLDNLALLCSAHHHAVHEGGWRLARGPDAILGFESPSGRRFEVGPRGRPRGKPGGEPGGQHGGQHGGHPRGQPPMAGSDPWTPPAHSN